MIKNGRFKNYMAETETSTCLLVNGRVDLGAAEGVSPLSVVGTELARIAKECSPAIVVKYFCDQHRPAMNQSATVHLMASLVGQLLVQMMERGHQGRPGVPDQGRLAECREAEAQHPLHHIPRTYRPASGRNRVLLYH